MSPNGSGDDDDDDDDDNALLDEQTPANTTGKGKSRKKVQHTGEFKPDSYTYKNGMSRKLPPMHDIYDIYKDIAANLLKGGLGEVLHKSHGRPLRVGTMCSGTESPILGWTMLQKSKLTPYQCMLD